MVTTTRTVEVKVDTIKAALLFAAKDDRRKNLEGACIEHGPTGTRMVATDGNRLIVIRLDDEVSETPGRYVVSREVLERAVKAYAKLQTIAFTWEQDTNPDPTREGVTIVSVARVHVADMPTVDVTEAFGKFPEYERLIPLKPSGVTAQFNALYLADCSKAKKLFGARHGAQGIVEVAHNGDGPALVDLGADAFAIVMPMRGEAATLPDWYTGKAPKVETKKAA